MSEKNRYGIDEDRYLKENVGEKKKRISEGKDCAIEGKFES